MISPSSLSERDAALGAAPPVVLAQTSPWRTHALFFAASVAVCLLGYRDVIFGGRTFLPVGQTWAVYETPPYSAGYRGPAAAPFSSGLDVAAHAWVVQTAAYYERRAVAQGTLPLWDRHAAMGRPLLANGQTPALNPLHWLVWIDPDSPALWDAYFLLLRFLAALFACYLLRELRVPDEWCLLGAVFAGLNGAFTVYVNRADLGSFAMMPALLMLTARLRNAPGAGAAAALVACIYCALTAGHPEPAIGVLLTSGGFAIGMVAMPGPAGSRRRFAIFYACAVVVAVLVTAPSWLPLLALIGQSWHGHPASRGTEAMPGYTALQWLMPDALSPTLRSGMFAGPFLVFSFLGVTAGLLGILGLVSIATRPGRLRLLWLAVPLLLGLKVFNLWGTRWLGKLPLLSLMNIYMYFPAAVLLTVGIAGIAALADLRSRPPRARLLILAVSFAVVLELVLLAPRYVPPHLFQWENWPIKAMFAVNIAGGAALLAWAASAGPRLVRHGALLGLALLLGVDLASYQQPLSARGNPTARAPYVEWLLQQQRAEAPFRVMGMGPYFMPNFATAFGLDDVRVCDALQPRRYVEFVTRFLQHQRVDLWFLSADPEHGFILPNPMLDMLNVRYLVTDLSTFPLPVSGLAPSHAQSLKRGQRDSAGGEADFRLAYADAGMGASGGVLENLRVWPRAFIVGQPVIAGGAELAELEKPREGRGPFAVVGLDFPRAEWDAACANSACTARSDALPVRDLREGINDLTLSVEAKSPAVLVLSDTLADGWRAWVDGREQQLFHVNYLFRGLILTPGQHQVRMRYWPREWTTAFALCGLGLALAAAALVVAWTRPRSMP
jgi:hypothetical protein